MADRTGYGDAIGVGACRRVNAGLGSRRGLTLSFRIVGVQGDGIEGARPGEIPAACSS